MNKLPIVGTFVLFGCAHFNVFGDPSEKSRNALGVIEERYGPVTETGGDDEKYYHLGIRPLFFRERGEWVSYQDLYVAAGYGDQASLEYSARKHWYVPGDGPEIGLVAQGDTLLPINLRMAVQDIVEGIDVIPNAARTEVFAGWYGMPVRPPIVVSSMQVDLEKDMKLPDFKIVDGDGIPDSVLNVGLDQVKEQRRRTWGNSEPPALTEDADTEVSTFLRKASKYDFERENVSVYVFVQGAESEWIDLNSSFICHDQVSEEAWILGDGLEFLCGADFDLDGSWEYLFWIDRYNENGYLLAGDKLRRISKYIWDYH